MLFVAAQISVEAVFEAAFVAAGCGVVAAAGVVCPVAANARKALVAATAIENTDSFAFTGCNFSRARPRSLLASNNEGATSAAANPADIMQRSIRAAAVQLRAHDRGDFPRVLESILGVARHAARDANLLVLPESTFPGYVLGKEPVADGDIDAALEALCVLARHTSTVIVAGAAVTENGATHNGALVFDADGSLAGRADKLFLWHFDRRWFSGGERIAPIRTRAGSLGVLVCADGRLPTISRSLVDRGAEILVMPTAWVTSGRDPHALENVQADLLARVRAFENRVPFVAANKCGSELGMVAYCGKSQIIDAAGEVVALASERRPETLCAGVAIGAGRPARVAAVNPARRDRTGSQRLRIAISCEALPSDIDERLDLLDDDHAISPEDPERLTSLDRQIALASVDDATVLDPGGLVPYRRAGFALICWSTSLRPPWLERIARARAIELRLYLVVFDRIARRAFAVDPDGAILAGTFDGYRLASFAFDSRKVHDTAVAPGTDIEEGLERIAAIIST